MTRLILVTTHGDAEVELLPEAPRTVEHVTALLRHGCYSRSTFYRAQRREHWAAGREFSVLQGGPQRDGLATVAHEPGALPHGRGTVSLARAAPGTAAAEFFICFDRTAPSLDPGAGPPMDGEGFAVFGQVVCGLEVLEQIHGLPTTTDAPHPVMRHQMLERPVPIELRLDR